MNIYNSENQVCLSFKRSLIRSRSLVFCGASNDLRGIRTPNKASTKRPSSQARPRIESRKSNNTGSPNMKSEKEILDHMITVISQNIIEARSYMNTAGYVKKYACAQTIAALAVSLKPALQYMKTYSKEAAEFVEDIEEVLLEAELAGIIKFSKVKKFNDDKK